MERPVAQFRPIGIIHHDVPDDAVRIKRRDLIARIHIFPEWEEALEGIEDFSHLFVLFWLHRVNTSDIPVKVHPRGIRSLPLVGLFATRTPRRPNPIGLAVTELIERKGAVLSVKGLDAYDGTPVLDLKPYDPWDRVEHPKVPQWWETIAADFHHRDKG